MAARRSYVAARSAFTVASAPNSASSARTAGRCRNSSMDGITLKFDTSLWVLESPARGNSAILCQRAMTSDPPRYRPLERFWPYADLPEQPSDEELAALDPDLYEALFGARPRAFSISLVFPALDAPDFERALDIARASAEFRETGSGAAHRYRARFWSSDAA